MLSVSELEKHYDVRKTAFSRKKKILKAVDKVSFDLEKGKTLGVVGESGSGKSTLARCLLLLEKPDGGAVKFFAQNLLTMGDNDLKNLRRNMQIIFQDPYSSLNPRKKVCDAIAEPLLVHDMAGVGQVKEGVITILQKVGLDDDFLDKYPHEMSGGQRQRVAIGRALATNPALLIADEPVSSLDVSVQAQVVNLFLDIKQQFGISMIFVSHDLNIVRFVSDEIMVMYRGRVVEIGKKEEVFFRPLHPYTQMLIRASRGELCKAKEADTSGQTEGCPYYERCEHRDRRCGTQEPTLTGSDDHRAACLKVAN